MSARAVAEEFVTAFTEKDEARLISTMHEDVTLEGPFPIGKKAGATDAAGALLGVRRLGVRIDAPEETDVALVSTVRSPAGAMVLKFTVVGGHITRLDVEKP